jgi:D-amino-acid dehydrogenase
VVGGGVVGSSAAYHLAARGEEVVLVDRGDPGRATDAGAGIVAPGLSTALARETEPLAFAAVGYYPRLLEELRELGRLAVGYDVVGAVHVARNDAEKGRLTDVRRLFEERRAAGVANIGEIATLDGTQLRSLCPALAEEHAGVHASGAARVDGRRLQDALVSAFMLCGGERRAGSAELVLSAARAVGVEVGGERLPADVVVLATGAWSDAFTRATGARLDVAPQRGQIVHLALPDAETSRWPILYGFDHRYVLTFPRHTVVIGATRETGAGFDRRVTAAGQHELLRFGLELAPGLANATVTETRVGFRPLAGDGRPLIGPLPSYEGLFVATGLGALGLTLGPYVGAVVADLVQGRPPALDLGPYALDRRPR